MPVGPTAFTCAEETLSVSKNILTSSVARFALLVGVAIAAANIGGCPAATSSPNLTGKWVGTASSSFDDLYYEWDLTQTATAVTGTIYLALPDRSAYGRYRVTGTFDGTNFVYQGGEFLENVAPPGGFWCAAAGTLRFSDSGVDTLSGGWSCAGATGDVELERQ